MALRPCDECGNEISDRSASCPRCGAPVESEDAVMRRRDDPTRRAKIAMHWLLSLGAVALVATAVYSQLPVRTRDDLSLAASRAGIVGRVVPWAERAGAMLRSMMSGPSGVAAARSIQAIAHPTGRNAQLGDYDVRRVGDRISVRISASWQGGFSGVGYATDVVWEFDETRHISATVVSDSALVRIAAKNARRLDDYFRLELYPVLRSNLGD
jgi:hypothetical protein